MKTLKILSAAAMLTTPVFVGDITASANPGLCSALKNGATWTARDNSRNAGKSGKIKLSGGCSVGSSGTATITWDGKTKVKAYKVKSNRIKIGNKSIRGRLNDDGTWTVTNTSSPV